jgi:hypothetical protein
MHALLTAIANVAKSLLPLMPQGTITERASSLRLIVSPGTKVVLHTPFSAIGLIVIRLWSKYGHSRVNSKSINESTGNMVVGFGGEAAIETMMHACNAGITFNHGAPSPTRVVLDQELTEPGRLVAIDHADPLYLVEVHVRLGMRVVVEVIETTGGKK